MLSPDGKKTPTRGVGAKRLKQVEAGSKYKSLYKLGLWNCQQKCIVHYILVHDVQRYCHFFREKHLVEPAWANGRS